LREAGLSKVAKGKCARNFLTADYADFSDGIGSEDGRLRIEDRGWQTKTASPSSIIYSLSSWPLSIRVIRVIRGRSSRRDFEILVHAGREVGALHFGEIKHAAMVTDFATDEHGFARIRIGILTADCADFSDGIGSEDGRLRIEGGKQELLRHPPLSILYLRGLPIRVIRVIRG
jgi:hypothetical protein